jgi:hypothetical protein
MHKRELKPGTYVRAKKDISFIYKGEVGTIVSDNRFVSRVKYPYGILICYRNEIAIVPKAKRPAWTYIQGVKHGQR